MNLAEEADFETSIYHYFLFKAEQWQSAAAAQEKAAKKHAPPKLAPPVPPTNDAAKNDGIKKPAAKESSEKKTDDKANSTVKNIPTTAEEKTDQNSGTFAKPSTTATPATDSSTNKNLTTAKETTAKESDTSVKPSATAAPTATDCSTDKNPIPEKKDLANDKVSATGAPAAAAPATTGASPATKPPPSASWWNAPFAGYYPYPPVAPYPAQSPGNMPPPPGPYMMPPSPWYQHPPPGQHAPGMNPPPPTAAATAAPTVTQHPPAVVAAPPPGQQPPTPAPSYYGPVSPSDIAARYKKVADVFRQEFPQYAMRLFPNAEHVPPEVTMRYFCYPRIQQEVTSLQNYSRALEAQRPRRGPPSKISELVVPGATPPKKKAKVRVTYRKDIPDDVKELLGKYRKESTAMKRKVARLQTRVAESKEKLKVKASSPPAPVKPPPPVASAAVVPAKPRAPPKPDEPPATFESRFKELQDFKRANNHARVPGRVPGLGSWVADLRKNYRICLENPECYKEDVDERLLRNAELNKKRLDMLDSVGFEFNVARKALPWQERFDQMLEFKEKNGHCDVPRQYKENPALGEWVHRQRESYAKGEKCIQGERKEKLEAVGFKWRTGTRGVKVTWEDRIEQCRNYRRVHGHLKVTPPLDPFRAKKIKDMGDKALEDPELTEEEKAYINSTEEERNFQSWAFRQRDQCRRFLDGKKSSLDKRRISQLEQLGFNFESKGYIGRRGENGARGAKRDEEVYKLRVSQLKKVKDLYGDCNDLKNIEKVYQGEDLKSVAAWMKNQRKLYKAWKNGKWSSLSEDRRQMLEAIDFNFEPRKHYAPYGSKKRAREESAELSGAALAADGSDDDSTMRDLRYIQGEEC